MGIIKARLLLLWLGCCGLCMAKEGWPGQRRYNNIKAKQDAALKQYDYQRDVLSHNYTFVVGAHHSGTTLMDLLICRSPEASCIDAPFVAESEAQHLQVVYKTAGGFGGMFAYGYNPEAHMTETHEKATWQTAVMLYGVWGEYWDLSKPTLVEKSPPHLIKTRFFQKIFTPDRTRFVVVFRHPLASAHFRYGGSGKDDKGLFVNRMQRTCGEFYLRHWHQLHNVFLQDLHDGLDRSHVLWVPFEHFSGYGAPSAEAGQRRMQKMLDQIYDFLGVARPSSDLEFVTPTPAAAGPSSQSAGGAGAAGTSGNSQSDSQRASSSSSSSTSTPTAGQAKSARRRRRSTGAVVQPAAGNSMGGSQRKLLEYHGDHHHVKVLWSDPLSWVPDFFPRMADPDSEACKDLQKTYGNFLQHFGYTITHVRNITRPQLPAGKLLWLEEGEY